MPSFRIPIAWRIIDPDPSGPIRVTSRANLGLEVLAQAGVWIWAPHCVVDSGSNYTLFSAEWARQANIPLPGTTSRLPLRTAAGIQHATVRDGEIRVRFGQLPGQVFRLYCLFSEDYSPSAPPLLGLNNFFETFRVSFDGRFAPDAPAGHVLFETD